MPTTFFIGLLCFGVPVMARLARGEYLNPFTIQIVHTIQHTVFDVRFFVETILCPGEIWNIDVNGFETDWSFLHRYLRLIA